MKSLGKAGILAAAPELAFQQFAQLVTLHLARGGAWQLGDRADPFRPLVARQALARSRGRGRRIAIVLWRDEKREALQPVGVGHRDAGRLGHGLIAERRFLELRRPDPLPRDLDELVGAALVNVKTLRIAQEKVARAEPAVAELAARVLRKVGIAARLCGMAQPEHARLARRR